MKRTHEASGGSKGSQKLRLLLHTVDGCVPFLTPSILEKYFPPSDDLILGLAVRDTCINATLESDVKVALKSDENDDSNAKKRATANRGYTFSSTVSPDPWLMPYARFTVPSFSLTEDSKNTSSKVGGEVVWNGDELLIWTPHGRQPLKPETYANASFGLNSHHTLSLYDMASALSKKRQEKARSRCISLWEDFQKRYSETQPSQTKLWAPVHLPLIQHDAVRQHTIQSLKNAFGIVILGQWQEAYIKDIEELKVSNVAVLATESLSDILRIASSGVIDTIGTDLPSQWTKKKRAFILDLDAGSSEPIKRSKVDQKENDVQLDMDGCIDLAEKCFERDPRPLLPNCSCMTCRNNKFTRSYMHHLIQAKELIVDTLLFAHNLHHLLQLIRALSDTNDIHILGTKLQEQINAVATTS